MDDAALLIGKYRSRGLLLDPNLLLLYLVGAVNPALVGTGQYNRLSPFAVQDVAILRHLIAAFAHVVTTAHVLTAVSNLLNDMHSGAKQRVLTAFAETLEVISEQELSIYQVAHRQDFRYLGLTDSVLAELSGKFLIVSKDGRMVDVLRQSGMEALKWVEVLGLSVDLA